MFDIKAQCKQVEDAMKQVFDYWLSVAEDTIKMYKKK